jgi:hypothetical protein
MRNVQQTTNIIFDSTKCNAKMTTIKSYLSIVQLLLCKTLEPCSMKRIKQVKKGQQKQMTIKP